MILAISCLGKESQTIELTGTPADFPEFADSGIDGTIALRLDVTPLSGDSHLVQGEASGILAAEGGRCLEPISLPFSVSFNLLLDRQDPTGLEWVEDDDQGVEDYQAHLGPDVTEVPLQSIIAEQVDLNYNLHPLPDLDAAGCCVQCGRPAPTVEKPKKAEGVDPRWAKLQDIQAFKGGSPVNGSTKPGQEKTS
jgi:uncharacterized metal-binding protein YceD (DUF177 family)